MIWIGLVFLLLMLFVFLSRVRISIYYKREAENDRIKVEIGLLNGLLPFRLKIPSLKVKEDGIAYKETAQSTLNTTKKKRRLLSLRDLKEYHIVVQEAIENIVGLQKIIKRFLAKMQIIRFHWNTRIGTGDAAETGILSGIVWGIKGIFVYFLARFLQLNVTPHIRIEPSFMQACLQTEFECIVRFRIGNAIIAGLLILIHMRKGSKIKWQSIQSKGS